MVNATRHQDTVAASLQRVRARGHTDGWLLFQLGGRQDVEHTLVQAQRWAESAVPESAEAARSAAYSLGLRDALAEFATALEETGEQ